MKLIKIICFFICAFCILSLGRDVARYIHYEEPHVAVVPIHGKIYHHRTIINSLRDAFHNPNTTSVVLHIDSVGGSLHATEEIIYELKNLKQEFSHKKLLVYARNHCCSGAYYIASYADHIYTEPFCLIGSIGVFIPGLYQSKQYMEQSGIKVVFENEYFNPINVSENFLKDKREIVKHSYEKFVHNVQINRNGKLKKEPLIFEAKIFSAPHAKEIGLIDDIIAYTALKKDLSQLFKVY